MSYYDKPFPSAAYDRWKVGDGDPYFTDESEQDEDERADEADNFEDEQDEDRVEDEDIDF